MFFNKTKDKPNIYFGQFSNKLNEVIHLLFTYETIFVKIIASLCQRSFLNIFLTICVHMYVCAYV